MKRGRNPRAGAAAATAVAVAAATAAGQNRAGNPAVSCQLRGGILRGAASFFLCGQSPVPDVQSGWATRTKRFWTIISSHDETLAAAGDSGRAECDGGGCSRGS